MGQGDQSGRHREGDTEAGGKEGRCSRDGQTWGSGRTEASSSQKASQIHEKLLDDSLIELIEAGTSTPLLSRQAQSSRLSLCMYLFIYLFIYLSIYLFIFGHAARLEAS